MPGVLGEIVRAPAPVPRDRLILDRSRIGGFLIDEHLSPGLRQALAPHVCIHARDLGASLTDTGACGTTPSSSSC